MLKAPVFSGAMRRGATSILLGLVGVACFAAEWTDRKEYDLVLKIRSEASAEKRLALLDQWKATYPKTELRQQRRELYLSVYQSMGSWPRMLEVAKEILAEQPDHFVGLYWYTLLLPSSKQVTPELLETGEKAARQLLGGLDTYFAAARKLPSVADEDWTKQRVTAEALAHRSLGWIHWQRADYPAAEAELVQCLQRDPNNAEVYTWFGTVVALEKVPEKQPAGLWFLAHAVSMKGDGALREEERQQIDALLEKWYTSYHGEGEGLDQLRASAAAGPFPPADFAIETAAALAARRQEEKLNRTNPELAAWLRIRKQLEGPDAESYFQTLRESPLPRLKGTVLSATPPVQPKTLVLGLSDPAVQEVTVNLSDPLRARVTPGMLVAFVGKAESFTREPFALTVSVTKDKLEVMAPDGPKPGNP
jgi:tetratricopeptide (TPR) repeat protein